MILSFRLDGLGRVVLQYLSFKHTMKFSFSSKLSIEPFQFPYTALLSVYVRELGDRTRMKSRGLLSIGRWQSWDFFGGNLTHKFHKFSGTRRWSCRPDSLSPNNHEKSIQTTHKIAYKVPPKLCTKFHQIAHKILLIHPHMLEWVEVARAGWGEC
jgi:hypothetical protein